MKNNCLLSLIIVISTIIPFGIFCQFENEIYISTPPVNNPKTLHAADFDGDGDLDLLCASEYDSRISWSEHIENGYFKPQKDISTNAYYASSAFAADLDNDGDMDVLSSSLMDDKIAWYENNGLGEFGTEQIISSTIEHANFVCAKDFDGDALIDVLFATNNNSGGIDEIGWFKNLGSGNFSAEQIITNQAIHVAKCEVIDIDNDSDFDIISQELGQLNLFRNDGVGNFTSIVNITQTPNFEVYNCTFGDLNNDNLQDVVFSTGETLNLRWCINNGNGTFGLPQTITTLSNSVNSISAKDFDTDGDIDIAYTFGSSQDINWIENTNSGSFTTQHLLSPLLAYTTSFNLKFIESFDIDFDGDFEIFSASMEDDITECFLNNGGGIFNSSTIVSGQTKIAVNMIKSDIDNDGYEDIVSSTLGGNNPGVISWFKNLGNGTFDYQRLISTVLGGSYILYATDIDNDNLPEIFISPGSSGCVCLKNDGTGNFLVSQTFSSVSSLTKIASHDFDNDGDVDLFFSQFGGIKLYKNLGGSTFSSSVTVTSQQANDLQFKDWNNDGFADIVYSKNNAICWIQNLGNGNFSGFPSTIPNTTSGANYFTLEDIDNQNGFDILFSSTSVTPKIIGLYRNMGSNSFGPLEIINDQLLEPKDVLVNDIDGDNDLDLITGSFYDTLIISFENDGTGNFVSENSISENISVYKLVSYDFDLDGDSDLLSAGNKNISLFKNGNFSHHQVRGKLYFDENQNGIRDISEHGLHLAEISTNPALSFAYAYSNGSYFVNLNLSNPGSYELTPINFSNWDITSDSSSYHFILDSTFTFIDSLDFGFYPNNIFDSVSPTLTGSLPRCNNVINYWASVKNDGTTICSGIIDVELDPQISFISCEFVPDSIIGQHIYWHYDSLFFHESSNLNFTVHMPTFTSMGDTLVSTISVKTINEFGVMTSENMDTLNQVLVCAYDPNRKVVIPSGEGSLGYIKNTTNELEYQIDFQNTGNDTAINIVLKDFLNNNLDWLSLTTNASSHPFEISVFPSGEIHFVFKNIYLPDSTTNEIASHGFIKYRIDLKDNLTPGSTITNCALIYFDQNPAIITNTTLNTIEPESSLDLVESSESGEDMLKVYPNPFNNQITLIFSSPDLKPDLISIYDITGIKIKEVQNIYETKLTIDLSDLDEGLYIITASERNQTIKRNLKILKIRH